MPPSKLLLCYCNLHQWSKCCVTLVLENVCHCVSLSHLFLSVLKESVSDAVSLQQFYSNSNTPPRPWLRHTEGFRSREFLLFPSHSVKFAHPGHSEWPRLVFRVRGRQSSERFSWLYPGSDSRLPGEGWEDVCICFPSILTRNWDPKMIYKDSRCMALTSRGLSTVFPGK